MLSIKRLNQSSVTHNSAQTKVNETSWDFVDTNMHKDVILGSTAVGSGAAHHVVGGRVVTVRWRGGRKERGCGSEATWAVGCTVGQQLRHRVA